MTFITGNITNANPGPELYAVIETAALAQGWTLAKTVTIGANTHKVLKSAAAGNVQGLDWYLDINYPTTGASGGMRFAPFEDFNATTDVGFRGPFGHVSNTVVDPTTFSRYGASSFALESNWANSASQTSVSATLATSTFSYWISITRDRIVMLTTVEATAVLYTGFFEPTAAHAAHAGAALFPLVMTKLTGSAAATAGNPSMAFTRVPKASSGAQLNWVQSGVIPLSGPLAPYIGGRAGEAVSEYTGEVTLLRPSVIMGNSTFTSTTPYAAFVGLLRDVAVGFIAGPTVRGDTIVIGSDTWVASTATNGNTGLFIKQV